MCSSIMINKNSEGQQQLVLGSERRTQNLKCRMNASFREHVCDLEQFPSCTAHARACADSTCLHSGWIVWLGTGLDLDTFDENIGSKWRVTVCSYDGLPNCISLLDTAGGQDLQIPGILAADP